MLPFGLSDKSGPEINLPLRSVALWNSEARFWPNVVVKYHFETAEEKWCTNEWCTDFVWVFICCSVSNKPRWLQYGNWILIAEYRGMKSLHNFILFTVFRSHCESGKGLVFLKGGQSSPSGQTRPKWRVNKGYLRPINLCTSVCILAVAGEFSLWTEPQKTCYVSSVAKKPQNNMWLNHDGRVFLFLFL